MTDFTRFAIYYVPPEPLAAFGAAWLGWDMATGQTVAHPEVADLSPDEISQATATPRKYGLHGTLKPPFRLSQGTDRAALDAAFDALASTTAPAQCDGLRLSRLGHFLALVPVGDQTGIATLAGACVSGLDDFRAAAPAQELARRRAAGLSDRQDEMLMRWGYPYVFDEFRFHITLSGRLTASQADRIEAALGPALPDLPAPFRLDRISLVGETPEGFKLIRHAALTG